MNINFRCSLQITAFDGGSSRQGDEEDSESGNVRERERERATFHLYSDFGRHTKYMRLLNVMQRCHETTLSFYDPLFLNERANYSICFNFAEKRAER